MLHMYICTRSEFVLPLRIFIFHSVFSTSVTSATTAGGRTVRIADGADDASKLSPYVLTKQERATLDPNYKKPRRKVRKTQLAEMQMLPYPQAKWHFTSSIFIRATSFQNRYTPPYSGQSKPNTYPSCTLISGLSFSNAQLQMSISLIFRRAASKDGSMGLQFAPTLNS